MRLPAIFLITSFFCYGDIFGQTDIEDSTSFQSALGNSISIYHAYSADQSKLFNGNLYPEYQFPFREGSPFFMSDQFTHGTVVYDGIVFKNADLIYDDLRQFLISRNNVLRVQLVNERVSSFIIFDHHFIRIEADHEHPGIVKTGYYDLLYSGKTEVLKFTTKKIREVVSHDEGVLEFIDTADKYYVKINTSYLEVKSKSVLLDVFDRHRNEIQRFMKKNSLNLKKNKEAAIVQVAAYYDQLIK
jgi:hypothetical protein